MAPMALLPVVHNKKNNFTVVTLHYSADEEKNTAKWLAEAKRGMPERGWAREYEIDYSVYEGKVFFPEFSQYNVKESFYQPRETIYRGWDYGYHRPACLITKLNQDDQWCWLEAILGKDEGIKAFGERVRKYCLSHFPGAYYIDAGDPAGEQVSDKGDKTSVQVLEALDIFVRSKRQPIVQGAEIIRQKLVLRVDGKPGLLVNPDQVLLIDGFKGGLHYPEAREGRNQSEVYEKDGFYDHVFDAARYIASEVFNITGTKDYANDIIREGSPANDMRMGRVEVEDRHNEVSDIQHDIFSDTTSLLEDF